MENPEFLPLSSEFSTKALEKLAVESQKKPFRKLRLNESLVLRKSIERANQSSLPQSPRSRSSFIQQQNTSILQSSIKNLSKMKRRPSLFQKTLQTVYGQSQLTQSVSSPKWTEQKSKFSSTLRRFSDILSSQTIENRSPRKESIKGAQQPFDSTKLQAITMRNFQTLQPSLKPRQLKYRRKFVVNQSLNLPEIYHVTEQTKKQKSTFYQMHPYFLKKDDTKRLQRRIDKRQNLMGLQQLYLRLRNKQTSKIYKKNQLKQIIL